jgi:acyl-homoserine-lactone acylase
MVRQSARQPSPVHIQMSKLVPLLALAVAACTSCPSPSTPAAGGDLARWRAQAARVTITRDDWGIADVHG